MKRLIIKYCEHCGKQYNAHRTTSRFCSRTCKAKHQMGTVQSEETKKKRSETMSRNYQLELNNLGWAKGKKQSVETVAKRVRTILDQYASGKRTHWAKGLTKETDERIARMAATVKASFANGREVWVLSHRGYTSLEKTLYSQLEAEGIKYTPQKQICLKGIHTYPDAFVEPNICIYADSDYWHNYYYDAWQTKTLEKLGYKVLRFSEHEIKGNIISCVSKIKETMTIPRKD